jgi:UDP-hydrolysing UDP-N-acetyl-D-glucosamine 2-epimerase
VRTIGVVTVGRSDYGIYLPVLRAIQATPNLQLKLFVSGMHLSPEFGMTIRQIQDDGFEISDRVEMLVSSDTPEGLAKSMGLGIIGFGQVYSRTRPDILLVLGDRFEMFAAVVAAIPHAIPIAHIHGGEATEGAIDEAIRHAITKMSHLHFVATEQYRKRVIQMGEEPGRVFVSGAPGLDHLRSMNLLNPREVETLIGIPLHPAPLLVTFHPVTLEHEHTEFYIMELLSALDELGMPVIFTYPNADTDGRVIIRCIDYFVSTHSNAKVVVNLGVRAYFSLMKYAAAMVGNSSSGIIEAASFELPVVNIGNRQRGRIHGENVIDTAYDRQSIMDSISTSVSLQFHEKLKGMMNIYGDGLAADRIVSELQKVELNHLLLLKRFHNIDWEMQKR